MPLFVCDKCKAIENTALGHYWARGLGYHKDEEADKQALCSECMPVYFNDGSVSNKGGKWHGKFEKTIATTEIIKEMGEDNFIYVSDILNVTALNCCAETSKVKTNRDKIDRKGKRIAKKLICICGNTFKAKKDSICKECGELVKY